MSAAALTWNAHQIAKDQAEFLRERDPNLTEDQAFQLASQDQDVLEFRFDDFCDALTELMGRIDEGTDWTATVRNFGWMRLSGRKDFKARNGRELLQQVLPRTDCTFKVFDEGDHLAIQNWHHDSPMGDEWYRIFARKECDDDQADSPSIREVNYADAASATV